MWNFVIICVIIVTTTAIASQPENGLFPCRFSQFRCQNGTGCISMEYLCDGIRHCPDSSDETFCPLANKRSTRANACVLPAYPNHGTYKDLNNPQARPGQSVDSVVLTVYCRRGYGVVDKDKPNSNSTEVYCVNGIWYQNMPECIRFCKLDPEPSVRYMCHVPGVGLKVCDNYVAPGTLVSPYCNTPFYYSAESFPKMKCTIGFWNYIAKCKAECGRVAPKAFQLIIDGQEAKRGEIPWHVGIYRKELVTFEQICGGSLVSNNVVISAAHCFWSHVHKLLPASNYKVAISKLYRPWDSKEDVGVQKSNIKQIKIPSLFLGESTNFQEDIAVLILTTPFVYHTYVRPVCLNFDVNFERWQLQEGNTGKVAGWGLTTANGNASPILKVVDMPFINEINCIKTLPPSFTEYVTGDKFCAGYTNGTALCRGDSGGGLAFADRELGIDRYYLRGIVSAAPRNDEKLCNDNAYTTFTKITKHQEFINDALAESTSRTCPFYSFQCVDGSCVDQGADCDGKKDCADGSDEFNELCNPIMETDTESSGACVLPSYPDHGTYTVANVSNAKPGQRLETFVLTYSCFKGYKIRQIDSHSSFNGFRTVRCNNGVWYESLPWCIPELCEVAGRDGKCVPPSTCPSVLGDTLGKSETPLCTSPSDPMPLICCTDHVVASDRKAFLFNPLLKISTIRGTSISKDKCIEYMTTLDYSCKTESHLQKNTKIVEPNKLCDTEKRKQPKGETSATVRDSLRGEFPHMALLGYGETMDTASWECGGSVISEKFILTFAYCSSNSKLGPVKYIALGVLKRSDPIEMWQRYNVKNTFVHPNNNLYYETGNIALLETDRQIVFSSSVLPACLVADNRNVQYEYLDGFGVVIDPILRSDNLQSVLKVKFQGKNSSPVQSLPSRPTQEGITSPLQLQDNMQCPFLILGMLVYPADCSTGKNYTKFRTIDFYINWIENIVWL